MTARAWQYAPPEDVAALCDADKASRADRAVFVIHQLHVIYTGEQP